MSEKTALVFDTNFIIQHKDLDSVRDRLIAEGFEVYITQVAIDERIAQECNRWKEKYDELEKVRQKFSEFASIEITKSFDNMQNYYRDGMKKKYIGLFGEDIIPLKADQDSFFRILERAYAKIPPFIKGSSDKGFKDTLMWMSIVDFFGQQGESTVYFLTDDNGFRENVNVLQEEFRGATGKNIEIKSNSYYRELIGPKPELEPTEAIPVQHEVDFEELRDEIGQVISNICCCEIENMWGYPEWHKTFTSSLLFENADVEQIFERLEGKIRSHILEQNIAASVVLDVDDRIIDGDVKIPMKALEEVQKLYCRIRTMYPDLIQAFYSAVSAILNQNSNKTMLISDDEELPF